MDRDPKVGQTATPSSLKESVPEISDVDRDLRSALQLLAERARFITGAATVTIALGEGNSLICKASAGIGAAPPKSPLAIESGIAPELMAECVNNRQPAVCNDTEGDSRVNPEICRERRSGSIMLVPLIQDDDVIGVMELIAERKAAFEERDVQEVNRLATLVLTALEQSESAIPAAQQTPSSASSPSGQPLPPVQFGQLASVPTKNGWIPLPQRNEAERAHAAESARLGRSENLRRCTRCGFPVSPGRTVCLDCEAVEMAEGRTDEAASFAGLSQISRNSSKSWFHEHFYTIGIVLVSILTVIVLTLWAR